MKRSVRYAINTATALVKILTTPKVIAVDRSGDTSSDVSYETIEGKLNYSSERHGVMGSGIWKQKQNAVALMDVLNNMKRWGAYLF